MTQRDCHCEQLELGSEEDLLLNDTVLGNRDSQFTSLWHQAGALRCHLLNRYQSFIQLLNIISKKPANLPILSQKSIIRSLLYKMRRLILHLQRSCTAWSACST